MLAQEVLHATAAFANSAAFGTNVSAVRIEPAQGLTVAGPYESAADGSVLNFSVTVAAGAASGLRTVVITSAAGDSRIEPAPESVDDAERRVDPRAMLLYLARTESPLN